MLVTDLGIVTDPNFVQPEKATLPIDVTELGMMTDSSSVQFSKALLLMDVTLYFIPLCVTWLGIEIFPT